MAAAQRKRGRTRKNEVEEPAEEGKDEEMTGEGEEDEISCYERLREQRIRENMERLQKLGVMDLTRKLKSDYASQKRPRTNPTEKKPSLPSSDPPRRSSRLVNVARVSYQYNARVYLKKEKKESESETESEESEGIEIYVEEGLVPEIYTEEHLKLLGDCETPWTLYSEGYGEDGDRLYDQFNSSCHQCRQKTSGHRTNCSSCRLGNFCGDCLYMGYGENVLEASKKTNWICPKCRGICNCGRCRKAKGWKPTGDIYTKVSKRGYKSVAHYLIQTRQSEPKPEDLVDEDRSPTSEESPAANPEIKKAVSEGALNTQSDDKKNAEKCSDDEYVEEDEEHDDETDDDDIDNDD